MLGLGALLWSWWFPTSWYAVINGTDSDHVFLENKPHDCDFLKAPLGDNNCHYDRRVSTEKDSKTDKVNVYISWDKVEE